MPNYLFQCTVCESRFDVSRPMDRRDDPARCPVDDAVAERVFTVPNFNVPGGASPQPGIPKPPPSSGGYSHHGHSHGPGGHSHSH